MAKPKKNSTKLKINLTVREEQRNKLEQMAAIEKRSVSNLIEVMADERWERLAEQQGIAYAKTVPKAMNLKLDMDGPSDREKLRRAVLELVAERKGRKQKRRGSNVVVLTTALQLPIPETKSAFHLPRTLLHGITRSNSPRTRVSPVAIPRTLLAFIGLTTKRSP